MLGSLDYAPNGLAPSREGWTIRREEWLPAIPGAPRSSAIRRRIGADVREEVVPSVRLELTTYRLPSHFGFRRPVGFVGWTIPSPWPLREGRQVLPV